MKFRSLLIVLLVVAGASTVALAQDSGTVSGNPTLSLNVQDNHFTASQQKALKVTVMNDGRLIRGGPAQYETEVKTARNVLLTVDESELDDRYGEQIQVKSGPVAAGTIPEGSAGPFAFQLETADSIEPGEYEIPISLEYEYTNYIEYSNTESPFYHENSRSRTVDVTIVIEDRPRFELDTNTEQRVIAGDSSSREITITNVGTQTATDTEFQFTSTNPSLFFDGMDSRQQRTNVHVGDLAPGETTTASVKIGANPETNPGSYQVESWATYTNKNGVEERSGTHRLGFEVTQHEQFTIVESESENVLAGDTGRQHLTIKNNGSETIYDADLSLVARDSTLFFGTLDNPQPSTDVFLGQLAPGETKQVSIRVGAVAETTPQAYPISARVNYEDATEVEKRSRSMKVGVDVGPEQTFAVDNVESTLRVGDDGDVRGTLTNVGPESVSNVVLVYKSKNANLFPRETEYAMGTLAPGESRSFQFRVDVSSEAEAGPRQLSYVVRYRNSFDQIRKSAAIDAAVEVAPEEDEFQLETVDSTVSAGSSETITVVVTNTGDQPLEEIEAKMFTDDPLNSDDDTAYIDRLGPGESTEIRFDVAAAGTAIEKDYPVSIDFNYEDARGDTELSDTYRLPVTVTVPEEEGPPMGIIIGIAAVVIALLAWWKRSWIQSRLG